MYSEDKLREIVNQAFTELGLAREPQALYAPILYNLSIGGKRIRPVLCLLCYQLYKENIDNHILMPALGLEVFHGFTLIHDDIMDNADIRRGQPTVHKKWDVNTAILSGDAMNIEAYRLMSLCKPAYLPAVLEVFNKTAAQVCEGQQLDMDFESLSIITEEDYLEMIRLKTAVLIAAAAKIGGIAAGASADDCESLYRFGCNLGLAFQIQDDILDTYGDPAIFGKAIGGDIAAGKKTFLLIAALKASSGNDLKQLNSVLLNNGMEREERYAKVKAAYDKLNVKATADAKVNELFTKALGELNSIKLKDGHKDSLVAFAHTLVDRIY